MTDVSIRRATQRDVELIAPLFDAYRRFYERASDEETLRTQAQALIELYAREDKTDVFGVALVRALSAVRATNRNAPMLNAWRTAWLKLARKGLGGDEGTSDALALPLRFLDTAIRYHQTQDLRHLLKLPVEERKLVVPLIAKKRRGK